MKRLCLPMQPLGTGARQIEDTPAVLQVGWRQSKPKENKPEKNAC